MKEALSTDLQFLVCVSESFLKQSLIYPKKKKKVNKTHTVQFATHTVQFAKL